MLPLSMIASAKNIAGNARTGVIARPLLGILLCAVALSACGARSSLLDVETWLEGERADGAATGGQGGQGAALLDPGHDEDCGKALKGPFMVRIPLPDGGSYCIDSTEVSTRHYRAFLRADVPFTQQPSYCAWNERYAPGFHPGDEEPWPADDLPMDSADWCDARAYCAWAGKRLCGRIGGGNIPVSHPLEDHPVDPLHEEWAYACTAGGTRTYPYGDVYDETGCVTIAYDGDPGYAESTDHVRPIREAKKCEGGFPGLYDMGGNVSEWVDESNQQVGEGDSVSAFGGYYASDSIEARCITRYGELRSTNSGGTGIRCCKDGP